MVSGLPDYEFPAGGRAYYGCEAVTEGLIYFMVLFNPWALGTTQVWSTWVMNVTGYLLGLLLLVKHLICWRTGYQPSRWGGATSLEAADTSDAGTKRPRVTGALVVLTFTVLAYCLISALNARGTFSAAQQSYQYFNHYLPWLPHSYDQASTWFVFWEYLGLALAFWATRDWLLGRSRRERQVALEEPLDASAAATPASPLRALPRILPDRLRRFLWVLCLNGAVLAVECLIQRQDQSDKLLWLVPTRMRTQAMDLYGPYAYRGNAAQYFNLLWPVCLAFWWLLRQEARQAQRFGARLGGSAHVLLFPCLLLMAASPVISTSRGGTLVALGILVASLLVLFLSHRTGRWLGRLALFGLALLALGGASALNWGPLTDRFEDVFSDGVSVRAEIHRNATQMAKDFPVLGSGPGSFCSLYSWYRQKMDQFWAAQAHNDWLETRITFGWAGFGLIVLALLLVLSHWWTGRGITCLWLFTALLWVALAGCLVHATFDFPLQIHSVLSLFLFLCAILASAVRPLPAAH